jgi:hypothetical protein
MRPARYFAVSGAIEIFDFIFLDVELFLCAVLNAAPGPVGSGKLALKMPVSDGAGSDVLGWTARCSAGHGTDDVVCLVRAIFMAFLRLR